jgi:hypothetical protein
MGVVGANIDAIMTAHFLEAYPEVGLQILNKMTDMDCTIGIRKC